MKKYIILFSLFLFSFVLQANNKIDSLQALLYDDDLNQKEITNVLMDIGIEYSNKENYPQAIFYLKKALKKAEQSSDKTKLGSMYNHLGVLYQRINDYNNSLIYYLEALKYLDEDGYEIQEVSTLMNIGVLYSDIGELDNALKFLNKADSLHIEYKEITTVEIVTNLGLVYSLLGSYEKGIHYYNKALQLISPENDSISLARLYNNIGVVYEKQEKYSDALDLYNDALQIYKSLNLKVGIGITLMNIGFINYTQGDYNLAIESTNNALIYLKELGYNKAIINSYDQLSEIYAKKNDYKKAYNYKVLRNEISDTLFSPELSTKLAELQTKYEIEKIEEKNKLEIKILEKDKTLINYRWAVIVGVLVIVLIVFGWLYNRRLNQKKIVDIKYEKTNIEKLRLSDELDFKNKELTSYTLHFIQKNKMLTDIEEKLRVTQNSSAQEKNIYIQELLSLIKSSSDFDKDWEDFKMIFEQVNNDFYRTLQNRFPKLTPNELNLCALFKINLSSKEIAVMMGISPHGINTARYRLRKKMELSKDEDLVKVIMSI